MKHLIPLLLAGALLATAGAALAAEPNTETPTNMEESGKKLSSTLTLGYDSQNILYGYRTGDELWHADIWMVYDLGHRFFLNGGSWFGIQSDNKYREIDGYLGLDYSLTDAWSIGLQYSLFGYLEVPYETKSEVNEYAAHLSYWGEHFSLQLRNQYDEEGEGSLFRIIGGYVSPSLGIVSLKLDAEAGYAFKYFIEGNRWNHVLLKASLPCQMTSMISIAPFIAESIPLSAIDSFENDEFYGGVNAVCSF